MIAWRGARREVAKAARGEPQKAYNSHQPESQQEPLEGHDVDSRGRDVDPMGGREVELEGATRGSQGRAT